jgi:hypothetical protein
MRVLSAVLARSVALLEKAVPELDLNEQLATARRIPVSSLRIYPNKLKW